MIVATYWKKPARLRGRRGLMAALVTVIYLLAGALHGLCDMDVTNPAGNGAIPVVAQADGADGGNAGSSHGGVPAERHCHGCFAASLSQPVPLAIVIELRYADPPQPYVHIAGVRLDTETPPPKRLG